MQVGDKLPHRVEPCVDLHDVLQRLFDPHAQHARAHRGARLIQEMQQSASLRTLKMQGFGKFEVAARGRVERHKEAAPQNIDLSDVRERVLLRFFKVGHQRARGGDSKRHLLAAKGCKRGDVKMPQEPGFGLCGVEKATALHAVKRLDAPRKRLLQK